MIMILILILKPDYHLSWAIKLSSLKEIVDIIRCLDPKNAAGFIAITPKTLKNLYKQRITIIFLDMSGMKPAWTYICLMRQLPYYLTVK